MMYKQKVIFPGFIWSGNLVQEYSGIFSVNLADGWTNATDEGHTNGQMEFQVESHFGWQTDESCY